MKPKLFEQTAKVLFFATLDESFAINNAEEISENSKSIPEALSSVCKKLSLAHDKNHKVQPIKGHFAFPAGVDISHWREFRLNSSREDFEAVLLRWVGKFEDKDITKAVGITEGSLKSRYNSGLRNLGSLLIKEHS